MHRKPFKLQKPIDEQVVGLETFLQDVARTGLRGAWGEYSGIGVQLEVLVPFSPVFIITMPKINTALSTTTYSGVMSFTNIAQIGATYLPGIGIVKDGVIAVSDKSFTVGVNSNLNTGGQTYTYFIVG